MTREQLEELKRNVEIGLELASVIPPELQGTGSARSIYRQTGERTPRLVLRLLLERERAVEALRKAPDDCYLGRQPDGSPDPSKHYFDGGHGPAAPDECPSCAARAALAFVEEEA